MKQTIILSVISWVIIGCGLAPGGIVDLSPDETGNRIAVVKNGKVAYLPAKRSNIGSGRVGGGACRYIRRASNGDLYVTGPWIDLFRSTDGGFHWTKSPMNVEHRRRPFVSAFTILDDDTFLVSFTSDRSMARSTDYGKTWKSYKINPDISPCKHMFAWNGDMIQLSDGTVLQTIDTRVGMDERHDDEGNKLPPQLTRTFLYVIRSNDGGRTWGDKSLLPGVGGEVHLLELPSGKVTACVRKQRTVRLPGDPANALEYMKGNGYNPLASGGVIEIGQQTMWIKNMFVSESYDRGYTWVNEQQVSGFEQCSGDMSYLEDGTLVLQYLHRYNGGPVADSGIRARVSYDDGKTWEPEEYILSDGDNYPGGIAKSGGGMISMCPHRNQIQAVHWQPLAKDNREVDYQPGVATPAEVKAPVFDPDTRIELIADGKTTHQQATRSDILPVQPGMSASQVRYGRNGSTVQRSSSGVLYCAGSIMGEYMMTSEDDGKTWQRMELDIQGWGEMIGFKILRNGDFVIMYEPTGGGQRNFYTARSTDEGKTWSVIMGDVDLSPFIHISGKDNNLIELADATLVAAVQLWGGRDESGAKAAGTENKAMAYTLRSTDGGVTWPQRASICDLTGKSRLVRLQSGKLLACVQNIKPGPYNTFYIAESIDGGITWSNPREALAGHNPSTAGMLQLADSRVVLQYLRDAQPGKSSNVSWYAGCGMRAVISDDEGKTWQDPLYVVSRVYASGEEPKGFGAYLGDTAELADGRLLTTGTIRVSSQNRFSAITWKP